MSEQYEAAVRYQHQLYWSQRNKSGSRNGSATSPSTPGKSDGVVSPLLSPLVSPNGSNPSPSSSSASFCTGIEAIVSGFEAMMDGLPSGNCVSPPLSPISGRRTPVEPPAPEGEHELEEEEEEEVVPDPQKQHTGDFRWSIFQETFPATELYYWGFIISENFYFPPGNGAYLELRASPEGAEGEEDKEEEEEEKEEEEETRLSESNCITAFIMYCRRCCL